MENSTITDKVKVCLNLSAIFGNLSVFETLDKFFQLSMSREFKFLKMKTSKQITHSSTKMNKSKNKREKYLLLDQFYTQFGFD